MKKTISLEEMQGDIGTFKLEATGDVVHRFRKNSIADQAWVKKEFGKSLSSMFGKGSEVDFKTYGKLFFYFLEDRSPFKASTVTRFNFETDKDEQIHLTSFETFMDSVRGVAELSAMSDAFTVSMLGSKLPPDEAQKKILLAGMMDKAFVGEASSTHSPASTDGPSITSGH